MDPKSIEQILAQDTHIVAIHPPSHETSPIIDYTFFNHEAKEKVEKILQIVIDYITYPLIEDNFGANHSDRRAWREGMEQKYGELFNSYYSKNKLRGNVYGYTLQALRIVNLKVIDEKKEELTKKIIDITNSFPDNYDALSGCEKIQTMRTIEQKVYDFLTAIQNV